MSCYLILPLFEDPQMLTDLESRISRITGNLARFNLQNSTYMRNYHFVEYPGTAVQLSHELVEAPGKPALSYLVVNTDLVNVAGFGPNDLIQWINQYGQ